MIEYAIGDVQGCLQQLLQLLTAISFDRQRDRLWFVGDLVNRGPDSLAVLRFIKDLPIQPRITLGNHDLYFLSRLFAAHPKNPHDDTLDELMAADDKYELGHWLRQQSILYYDENHAVVMTHAGMPPHWTLQQACHYAKEFEQMLQSDQYVALLQNLYGNTPLQFSANISHLDKMRLICNYLTRMRFCDEQGQLIFDYKGDLAQAPGNIYPWFKLPRQQSLAATIIFGHWAALAGKCDTAGIYALDTGCVWGGRLTALRIHDRQRFAVSGIDDQALAEDHT